MSNFPYDFYDAWKTTEPDFSNPADNTMCPHKEDAPENCPVCTPDEEREHAETKRDDYDSHPDDCRCAYHNGNG